MIETNSLTYPGVRPLDPENADWLRNTLFDENSTTDFSKHFLVHQAPVIVQANGLTVDGTLEVEVAVPQTGGGYTFVPFRPTASGLILKLSLTRTTVVLFIAGRYRLRLKTDVPGVANAVKYESLWQLPHEFGIPDETGGGVTGGGVVFDHVGLERMVFAARLGSYTNTPLVIPDGVANTVTVPMSDTVLNSGATVTADAFTVADSGDYFVTVGLAPYVTSGTTAKLVSLHVEIEDVDGGGLASAVYVHYYNKDARNAGDAIANTNRVRMILTAGNHYRVRVYGAYDFANGGAAADQLSAKLINATTGVDIVTSNSITVAKLEA